MHVVRHSDPSAFRAAAEALLGADRIRHNLVLGLIEMLVSRPDVYPEFDLWCVEHAGEVVGAAMRTRPFNVIVAQPSRDGAVEALVDAIVAEGEPIPGVAGALPEADVFALRYTALTGAVAAYRMDQALHVLHAVRDVALPPGAARAATRNDVDLLVAWNRAFAGEAVHGDPGGTDEELARRRVERRIDGEGGAGYHFWEDGGPVSFVGHHGPTDGTSRVGPVYTPPEHRKRGYATALTAHVSRAILASGTPRCMLYTDLANPTSNAIYARIGYERLCDAAMIQFE